MKHYLFAVALICFGSSAQAQLASGSVLPPPTEVVAAPPVLGKLAPADWIKLGKNFGSRGQWQFGFDKSSTAGACAAYVVRAHAVMAGPCRDVFLLARDGAPVFHLGGAILYSGSKPNYTGRAGFNIGPAGAAALNQVSERIPYLESLGDVRAPSWAAYVGRITTVDYILGNINGQLDHGPGVKVNIPLADLRGLLP